MHVGAYIVLKSFIDITLRNLQTDQNSTLVPEKIKFMRFENLLEAT